nr:hypothetical protein [Tanacetum cinerariifolium]
MESGDWRVLLQADLRHRIVNKISLHTTLMYNGYFLFDCKAFAYPTVWLILVVGVGSVYISPSPYPALAGLGLLL